MFNPNQMKTSELLLSITCAIVSPAFAQVPGEKPEIFLPGLVSTGYNERDMAISPDGSEMFYTIQK